MRKAAPELLQAIGACLVVIGLVFWSLPLALVVAGLFLVLVANAPGGDPQTSSHPPGRVDHRADR